MTFSDFINNAGEMRSLNSLTPVNVFITLLITFILALIIYFTYRKNFNGVSYNHMFNVSLILMSVITATIIMTIRSNIVLSLGMVGALSIVRFRSAIKEPMDIIYLFWSISLGIIAGARLFEVAGIATVFISLIIFILVRFTNQLDLFLLIIQYEDGFENDILDILSEMSYSLKSKRAYGNTIELTVEIKRAHKGTTFVEDLNQIIGVKNVSFISYNGHFE